MPPSPAPPSSAPDPEFDIEIRYWPGTEPGERDRLRIEAAAMRWERLIRRDLPADRPVRGGAMTPIIFYPDNPVSRVTAAATADLGYEIDVGEAEPWAVPHSLNTIARGVVVARRRTVALELDEAAPRWSVSVVDPAGRIVGRLPRP